MTRNDAPPHRHVINGAWVDVSWWRPDLRDTAVRIQILSLVLAVPFAVWYWRLLYGANVQYEKGVAIFTIVVGLLSGALLSRPACCAREWIRLLCVPAVILGVGCFAGLGAGLAADKPFVGVTTATAVVLPAIIDVTANYRQCKRALWLRSVR